jgi:hypothetical protein
MQKIWEPEHEPDFLQVFVCSFFISDTSSHTLTDRRLIINKMGKAKEFRYKNMPPNLYTTFACKYLQEHKHKGTQILTFQTHKTRCTDYNSYILSLQFSGINISIELFQKFPP